MTDPITDMLTRIKNSQMAEHIKVQMPFSKVKFSIAEILKANNFVSETRKRGRGVKKTISIGLKYNSDKTPAIANFKRVSKPGQRIYKSFQEIRKVKSGFGIAVVSTSKGIMTGQQAKKNKLGGEVLFKLW